MLWAVSRRDLFAPGLAQAGLAPERVLYAECRNDEEVLAVMEEAVRHGSLAAVIGEVGRVEMAATRRLQLAAEEGGSAAFLLRRWRKAGADPLDAAVGGDDPLADRLRAVRAAALSRDRPV